MDFDINKIIEFRKELHSSPELSGKEKYTAKKIKNYIQAFNPNKIVEKIGGSGIAFVFDSEQPGPNIMFRCELDALPILEVNKFKHRSINNGVSHKCGHDGHMAVMVGLAKLISFTPPPKGKVTLLFQPAEETGQGALKVIEDPKFKKITPDYIFAFHNLPGFAKNKLIVKEGVFSYASSGLIVRLTGKTSHAAEPEKGMNPAFAVSAIIKAIETFSIMRGNTKPMIIVTPIHIKLGERAFGTSPGFAELMFTLRASTDKDFQYIKSILEKTVNENATSYGLKVDFEWVEEFPVTQNHTQCNQYIVDAANDLGFPLHYLKEPFRWSEDLGHFLTQYPGALFGIGAGIDTPALHNPDYDFPDEIIKTGIQLFSRIYQKILS